MSEQNKPWLSVEQQIDRLATRGIKFELYSSEEAARYLAENNNYFRLKAYRKCFDRVQGGENDGCFVNLDFGMLVDLSVIDMYLRSELLLLAIDIEHFSKMRLLNELERVGEDGYSVVADFIDDPRNLSVDGRHNYVRAEIDRGKSSPYVRNLLGTYPSFDFPAWAFLEVIPFGRLVHFYRFVAERSGNKAMQNDSYLLQSVRVLRNACAHNNCIIDDMRRGVPVHAPQHSVSNALSRIGVSKGTRRIKLSNERFQGISTTLFVHSSLVPSTMLVRRGEELRHIIARTKKYESYYRENDVVRTGFAFIEAMVRGWY